MLTKQEKGRIYIILDNAMYYRSKVVKNFLEENSRIVFKFSPPYSPNLNIIERLWRILKKKVVYNKFYLKFEDFKKAVDGFFENETWRRKEFERT
jgi:transposase